MDYRRGKKQTARAALELKEMEACERELLGLAFNYSESLSGCRDYCCSEWRQVQVREIGYQHKSLDIEVENEFGFS